MIQSRERMTPFRPSDEDGQFGCENGVDKMPEW